MLISCWVSVVDDGPTLVQRFVVFVGAQSVSRVYRRYGYERVYLPLYKVADAPFHIQVTII